MEIKSYFVIKPEWIEHREEIKKKIEEEWFTISSKKIVKATKELISEVLYKDDPQRLLSLHEEHFPWKEIEIWLISGKTLNEFIELTWKDSNPILCPKWTIRRIYGKEGILINWYPYFLNSIHRPLNAKEFEDTIEWILKIVNDF